jgi:hypothetical protein
MCPDGCGPRPVEGKDLVGVGAAVRLRVGVDESGSEPRDGMEQRMLSVDGNLVGMDGADGRVDDNFAFGLI